MKKGSKQTAWQKLFNNVISHSEAWLLLGIFIAIVVVSVLVFR